MNETEEKKFIENQLNKFDYMGNGKNRIKEFEGFNSLNEFIQDEKLVEIKPLDEIPKGKKYYKKINYSLR